MRAAVVKAAGEPFALVERDVPEPARGQVRLRVAACGVCHSDKFVKDGLWPGLELPRVPGHEVVGTVEAVGAGVTHVVVGARAGIGWHGGHDGSCPRCLAGDFMHCGNAKVTGISFDGGYSERMLAPAVALAPVPDALSFAEAAPLLCAGVTTFNALRNAGARPGDLVAVQGLGGLGHLGVQFARAMGFEVAALSRGGDKEAFARQLGAHHYVDTAGEDLGARLGQLGGARVILATAPDSRSLSTLVAGLGVDGCLLIVGAPFEPFEVSALALISGRRRIQGWPSGSAADSADCLAFAARHGVRPLVETFPLEQAEAAYAHMLGGKARFRSVIEMRA
jgi:D-arabinose 1-dehydrogenase-like Zn-dependent alcohol dehydrogenase